MSDSRIPVLLLTGFLGSGKTTVLNHWLRLPELSDAAVIVNEFGEIGIDHALISSSNEDTIELATGCLCCMVRGDLVETLRELSERRVRGDIREFRSVLIETTGLADPAPIAQLLMTLPVARRFRLSRIITTVDSVNGASTLCRYREALRQVAMADDVIVTKEDIDPEAATGLLDHLRRINPGAAIHRSRPGRMPGPAALDHCGIYDPAAKPAEAAKWLNAEAFSNPSAPSMDHALRAEDTVGSHEYENSERNRHDTSIHSFCLEFASPLAWDDVAHWLDALVVAHGDQLLRVKGIAWIEGRDSPIVLQAVQKLFHPPFALSRWPREPRRSRFVFIVHDLTAEYIRSVLETIQSRRSPRNGAANQSQRPNHRPPM